ncbi:MAG TPA: tRNA (adenosine(37)-N6)-threonylcarbamoyltransferase complex dimerization subunit type 1 TsaB [Flavitalea sp.]|nr:tRNA (adenosine(37)-N6)-threonylcarbamoyltransferase complex dimerization subunit type 1 TsaB [Flavitalea sp.]
MALILSIDTALEDASLCIAEDAQVLGVRKNNRQTDHAAWIQVAIKDLLTETERKLSELSAIAVCAGPGSYTGLRVGMATAKGMCYALGIPLITESTLLLISQRVKKEIALTMVNGLPVLICPMIDARRMEVFTAFFDPEMNLKMPPGAIVLDEWSFSKEFKENVIIFCGNGSKKWQHLCNNTNAVFVEVSRNVEDLAESAEKKYQNAAFSDLAYTEPEYLKNVYTGKSK